MTNLVSDDAGIESYSARVAARAASIRPLRAMLTVLAVPFYVLGLLAGLVFVAVLWALGAVKLGLVDARARLAQPSAPVVVPPVADEGVD
jgi:hypothetical protein